jgi:opacity protein-like surface antigen
MFCHKPLVHSLAIAAALGACATVSEAGAADLSLPFANQETPSLDQNVEFGTGWYIRGDVGLAKDSTPLISPDLTQLIASVRQNSLNLGGGFGYKFNDMFRTDVIVDYFNPISSSGPGPSITCTTRISDEPTAGGGTVPVVTATDQCTPRGHSSIQRWDVLGNGYVDLGTWYGFTPYVGAGVGVSILRESGTVNYFMSNGLPYQVTTDGFSFNLDHSQSAMRYQFAWALMVGTSYALTSHALLDVGYRYLNLGTLSSFPNASGQISTHSVNDHELRIGIRYMID